jgi:hypothetical protein
MHSGLLLYFVWLLVTFPLVPHAMYRISSVDPVYKGSGLEINFYSANA